MYVTVAVKLTDLEIERPRPLPPYTRDIETSAWWKGWKSEGTVSAAIPMPVSVTSHCSRTSAARTICLMCSVIPP